MAINLINHRSEFMSTVVDNFNEIPEVKSGLNVFFPKQTVRTKAVTINVQRNGKPIAVDVQRCTDPIRREFSRSTEKIFIPPFYNESFDFTSCEAFDRVATINADAQMGDISSIMNETNDNLLDIKNGFDRARQKQQADIIQFGFVTFKNHDTIDFRRKAASMVTKTGTATWDVSTSDPKADLQAGCNFIRSVGGSTGNVVNAIMGEAAYSNLSNHPKIQAGADIKNIDRDKLVTPMMEASGLVYHGYISAGDFIVNLWTYNEEYEDDNKVSQRYIDTNNVCLLPSDFKAKEVFAGIASTYTNADGKPYIAITEGEFIVWDYVDSKKSTWEVGAKSAPLSFPISVDKMYTIKTK